MLDWTFFGLFLEFLSSMGLALYLRNNLGTEKKGFSFPLIGIFVMLVCMAALRYLERNTSMSVDVMYIYNPLSFVFRNAILPVSIVLFFWELLHERKWFKILLETPLFDLLGKSSYTFCLIHVGVLDFFLNDYVIHNILGKFILINLVVIALYKTLERPIHRLLATKR